MENMTARKPFNDLIYILLDLPTVKPSMQTVHFWDDRPIFIFLIFFRYCGANPLAYE